MSSTVLCSNISVPVKSAKIAGRQLKTLYIETTEKQFSAIEETVPL